MPKCRRCRKGRVKIISGIYEIPGTPERYATVHCQNPSCDVTYEVDVRVFNWIERETRLQRGTLRFPKRSSL